MHICMYIYTDIHIHKYYLLGLHNVFVNMFSMMAIWQWTKNPMGMITSPTLSIP